jgi:hypothetical protein
MARAKKATAAVVASASSSALTSPLTPLVPDPGPGTYLVTVVFTQGHGPEAVKLAEHVVEVETAHGRPQANSLAVMQLSCEHPELTTRSNVYIQVVDCQFVHVIDLSAAAA